MIQLLNDSQMVVNVVACGCIRCFEIIIFVGSDRSIYAVTDKMACAVNGELILSSPTGIAYRSKVDVFSSVCLSVCLVVNTITSE